MRLGLEKRGKSKTKGRDGLEVFFFGQEALAEMR